MSELDSENKVGKLKNSNIKLQLENSDLHVKDLGNSLHHKPEEEVMLLTDEHGHTKRSEEKEIDFIFDHDLWSSSQAESNWIWFFSLQFFSYQKWQSKNNKFLSIFQRFIRGINVKALGSKSERKGFQVIRKDPKMQRCKVFEYVQESKKGRFRENNGSTYNLQQQSQLDPQAPL